MALTRIQHCWNNEDPLDACGIAKLCELVMRTEEAGLPSPLKTASDIPQSNRIRPLSAWLASPGEMSLFYSRRGDLTVQQTVTKWKHWSPVAIDTLFLFSLGELVKYGQFQGLIRPARISCMCKTYGAPVEEAWFLQT
jgi:hypothetical protein